MNDFLPFPVSTEKRSQEEIDLFAWLALNRPNFETIIVDKTHPKDTSLWQPKYTAAEIGAFARMNGFSDGVISKHISSAAAISGRDINNMAASEVWSFEQKVRRLHEDRERIARKPLRAQWKRLALHTSLGIDFKEVA